MYRIAMEKLLKWRESKRRKPLIIEGARQVGKTWLMKEFGRLYYTDTVYINFDSNSRMAELFAPDLDTERLIMGLELYSGRKIDPDHTLLIFDEVQEVPRALSSLKYFYENAPEYHIVCAGSLLGIALHEGTSFPVGKVDFLKLYPLFFKEFLMATGKERFAELLSKQDYPMITSFKQTYIDMLKQYYFVGGMPEAVQSFAENKDFNEVREIQKRILAAYEQDFSKHAPNEIVPKIRMLWNSIPSQLARENKKFVYGLVREGARAKDYETAILWLSDCGLVHKISRVNAGGIPLKAYEDLKAFKLFLVDVGLLGRMAGLRQRTLLDGNDLFIEFKGALTEQYVCQQLKTIEDLGVYYYGAYQGLLKSTIVPYFRKKKLTLQELEARHLQMFYSEMLRRVTPNTVIHYHAVIHSALKYAVKTDMLIQNVADKVDRPKKNSFQPVFLSAEEMQKMFEALRGTRLELPVLVAAFYGFRRGEVLGLKWDAIDFERGTISVIRTVTTITVDGKQTEIEQQSAKTKSSLRTLPLIGSFREYFMQVKEAQELNKQVCGNCYNYEYDGFVFVNELGERMRVEYLTNAFPKFLESHGLRRMRFHDLRHSCASLLLANGVPLKHIQEWLGHSDFTTTANIYAHLDYKSKITSAQAMETGLVLPEGGDFSSRWGSIGAGENF